MGQLLFLFCNFPRSYPIFALETLFGDFWDAGYPVHFDWKPFFGDFWDALVSLKDGGVSRFDAGRQARRAERQSAGPLCPVPAADQPPRGGRPHLQLGEGNGCLKIYSRPPNRVVS